MKQGEAKKQTFETGFTNPFLPLNIYIPDGEPKVFDGRVYLYGSKDLYGGEYCCHKYHVYSAPVENLQEWTDHGPVLASTNEYAEEGILDGVSWSDGLLWAPDIVKRGDTYYLYFCLSDGSEGVAESPYPYGPFVNARQICMNGEPIQGIDPSVLQDGDNYYYTWGQGECRMAKLNADMCTLDSDTFASALISRADGAQGFHEGSSLRRIGGWYCIVYASEYQDKWPNNHTAPTKLDYAVSRNIYGPYERRGTIIDNTGIDPQSWNNHGSIIKIGDQWYVFYHGSSNNCKYTRRARVERIEVDEINGWINQAEMTSSGFAAELDPMQRIEMGYAYQLTGGAYLTERGANGESHPLIHIADGSSASWRYFDFGEKEETWKLTLCAKKLVSAGQSVPVTAEILANGEKKAEIRLDDGQKLHETELKLAGRTTLTVRFTGEAGRELAEAEWIEMMPEG